MSSLSPLNDPKNYTKDANSTGSGFFLVDKFMGYRHREDITNLPPGYMIPGSQNVLSNSSERVASRRGYTLDGQAYDFEGADNGVWVRSAYDWKMHIGQERHLKQFGDTIQYRYVYGDGTVEWLDLGGTYDSTTIAQYAEVWDPEESSDFLKFVDGGSEIYEWSGGVTTLDSVTSSTITKEGTETWGEENFYLFSVGLATITIVDFAGLALDSVGITVNGTLTTRTEGTNWTAATSNDATALSLATTLNAITGVSASADGAVVTILVDPGFSIDNLVISDSVNMTRTPSYYPTREVIIGGITYSYTGGADTTTLTGVIPDPTLGGHTAGDVVHQAVRVQTNAQMTGLPSAFQNDLIGTLYNQLYIGSLTSREVYVSYANVHDNFTFDTPRLPGQGALFTLDATAVGFVAQEDSMYISAGLDMIFKTKFTLSSDLTSQSLQIERLKTGPLEAAQSQNLIGKIKDYVIYMSNENRLDALGRIDNNFAYPQTETLSDPIELDFNELDFTDGQVFYFNEFVFISLPREGLVYMYNLYKRFWEAPQTLPVSVFSIIDGELYGHSFQSPQTFKLFDGTNDNGYDFMSSARFCYQNFGDRALLKNFNEFYVEGYIQGNTVLDFTFTYEIDGCRTESYSSLDGWDKQVVCIGGEGGSLGKNSIGKRSLAGRGKTISDNLPPKFRTIKTIPRLDFFEASFQFSSVSTDQRWELLAFGPLIENADKEPVSVKQ